jgi:hypothetical protein
VAERAVAPLSGDSAAFERFRASTVIDAERWRDGTGYDLDALLECTADERQVIEASLLSTGVADWRVVEALAALDTPAGRAAVVAAVDSQDPDVRNAAVRFAADLIPAADQLASLIAGLRSVRSFAGLSSTLDRVVELHPPEVVHELVAGCLHRSADVAVHFAAMLVYLHGKAPEPFDWEQRPFFLRFATDVHAERVAAFVDLCAMIAVDPAPFLTPGDLTQ